MNRLCLVAFVFALGLVAPAAEVLASDHADPIKLRNLEAGLTGLFAFPDGDRLVLVLGTRRALQSGKPYDLEPFEFAIHMDLNSAVSYDNEEVVARYGGRVVDPAEIAATVSFKFRLYENTNRKSVSLDGVDEELVAKLQSQLADGTIRVWTGVRDDPFIFPRFFKRNIIAMVLSIPFSSFPGEKDWVLWATTHRVQGGRQVDHVGRSNRTQLARFDFLNRIHPSEQVPKIRGKIESGQKIQEFLMKYLAPGADLFTYVFRLRKYDAQPDVMIFTTRREAGFPNGRRLADDVAGLTCAQGDCALQEVAFIEGGWPRKTSTDVPFLDGMPYLGRPWPDLPHEARAVSWARRSALIVFLVLAVWLTLRYARYHDYQP